MNKKNTAEYSALSIKDHNGESVDDILANVDQFIEGVYRDLNYTPPGYTSASTTTSSSSSSSSPVGNTSLSGIRGSGVVGKGTPVISPVKRRNMDEEIARINQICDNVDQNLRSIGLFMNSSSDNSISEDLLNINLNNSPTSSTSIIILNNTSSPVTTKVRKYNLQINHRRRRSSPKGSVARQIVDLSGIQTPEVFLIPVHQNNDNVVNDDDDDVILVSADIPPTVVDLCTPGSYEDLPRPRSTINYPQLNRRRLPFNDNDVGDSCCAGPSAARRRRTEPSPFTKTLDSSLSDTHKISNTGTSSSATTDNTGRTPYMCPVCMESCLQRQPTSTRCGHVYCKECIEQAIRVTHKCPMCNTKISRNQTFRIYL